MCAGNQDRHTEEEHHFSSVGGEIRSPVDLNLNFSALCFVLIAAGRSH